MGAALERNLRPNVFFKAVKHKRWPVARPPYNELQILPMPALATFTQGRSGQGSSP